MLADGGEAIGDLKVLRVQGDLFGPAASTPTAWRTLEAITPTQRRRLWKVLDKARRRAWTLAFCGSTGELLAGMMRPVRAESNTATDHIQALTDTIAAVPSTHRKDLLIRCDGAGASHALLGRLTEQASAVGGRKLDYSIGFSLTPEVKSAISALPSSAWTPAVNQDGHAHAGANVAELTRLMDLGRWPARIEDRIRTGKDIGLAHFPSRHYGINQTWLMLIAAGINLIAHTALLAFLGPQLHWPSLNRSGCGTSSCTSACA